jgi:hypothetical protein
VMFIHPAPGAAGVRKARRNPMLTAKHADAGGKFCLNPAYPQQHPPICSHVGQHAHKQKAELLKESGQESLNFFDVLPET